MALCTRICEAEIRQIKHSKQNIFICAVSSEDNSKIFEILKDIYTFFHFGSTTKENSVYCNNTTYLKTKFITFKITIYHNFSNCTFSKVSLVYVQQKYVKSKILSAVSLTCYLV